MNQSLNRHFHQQLIDLLGRQTGEIDALDEHLNSVKTAITENDIDALDSLLVQHRLPTAELETLEKNRHGVLKEYGFKASREGLEDCIRRFDSGELVSQYELFRQALMRLQRSIQLNNLLIDKSQQRVRQSLQLLTGQANIDSARTYSSDGQSQRQDSKRSIAQA